MNATPEQNNILQHTFQFSDAIDCYKSFRYVSKSWKNAVENIRVRGFPNLWIFHRAFDRLRVPRYYQKYLQAFQNVDINLTKVYHEKTWKPVKSLILKNLKNLRYIEISMDDEELEVGPCFPPNYDRFVFKLYKNSRQTAVQINDIRSLVPDFKMTKVENFWLNVLFFMTVESFESKLQKAVEKFENLQSISVLDVQNKASVVDLINQKYTKYCIFAHRAFITQYVPTKIMNCGSFLFTKYLNQVEYIIFQVDLFRNEREYKEYFEKCENLKAIALCTDMEFDEDFLEMPEVEEKIWVKRIAYIQSLGVKILPLVELMSEGKVYKQLLKNANLTWGFEFYSYGEYIFAL